jgi:hypothetical protein
MPAAGLYEVLEGIENELELERELGVRAFELDRGLLAPVGDGHAGRVALPAADDVGRAGRVTLPAGDGPSAADGRRAAVDVGQPARDVGQPARDDARRTTVDAGLYDFVFLHHDRLSQGGVEMMAKIVAAMKKTADSAPIVFVGERPRARIYVVLGGKAMKKWFPELRCSPGQWAKGAKGEDVLVTYSPEYILRLGPETPAVRKLKLAMWTSLKGVMQKL